MNLKHLVLNVNIESKVKKNISNIESAFLKSDTYIHILSFEYKFNLDKTIEIKFEVDINPPLDFITEEKLLLQPFSFFVKCFTPQDMFAGKMHAILFRNWKNRVKGRDWYDFEWYVKRATKVNLEHLKERMVESGDFQKEDTLTLEVLKEMLHKKIDTLDMQKAKDDVKVFIKDSDRLEFWSKEYFKLLANKIVI